MPGIPLYQPILTDGDWQRQKGIVAKVVKGETGIGAALIKLKAAYDKVPWQYFDPTYAGPMPKPRTRPELETRLKEAKAKGNLLEEFRKLCFTTRDLCKKVADDWKKNIVVPKSSREHVEKICKELENLALNTKSIGMDGFERCEQEIIRVEATAKQMVKGWVDRLGAVIPKVKTTPTVKFYKDNMHQQVRGLGTAISKIDEYKKFYTGDGWDKMVGDGFMSGVTDGEPVKKKVADVEKAYGKIKSAVG
jgi:hypothetical protein